jgi:flavin-dependent dehydrogenase
VVERSEFDAHLRRAAIAAGAEPVEGRADTPIAEDGRLAGFAVASTRLRADMIIGGDGATSHVAEVAGLVDPRRALWGFAVRTYLDEAVAEPHILFWTPAGGEAFPGYGWVFPAGRGRANVGLGIGVLADRSAARRATRELAAFVEHARRVGVLRPCSPARPPARALGAWLKMGLVGTAPARDRVLLVGDAAGLVNPLQGEGIAQAMDSGRAAAAAILGGVDRAASDYRGHLARTHGAYLSTAASAHRALLQRPKLVAPFTRNLTTPAVGRPLAGAWSLTWNDLLDGALPSRARAAATVVAGLGRVLTARSADRRWIQEHVEAPPRP